MWVVVLQGLDEHTFDCRSSPLIKLLRQKYRQII